MKATKNNQSGTLCSTKGFLIFLLFTLSLQNSFGQVFTNKEVGKKNQALSDSLKTAD